MSLFVEFINYLSSFPLTLKCLLCYNKYCNILERGHEEYRDHKEIFMDKRNPAFGYYNRDDDFNPPNHGKGNFHTIGNYWLTDCAKYPGGFFTKCKKLHALDIERLKLISSDSQIERICEKMNPKMTWAIEIDIAIIKPILQEENILPKDITDLDAINWLLEKCYGIQNQEEEAAK